MNDNTLMSRNNHGTLKMWNVDKAGSTNTDGNDGKYRFQLDTELVDHIYDVVRSDKKSIFMAYKETTGIVRICYFTGLVLRPVEISSTASYMESPHCGTSDPGFDPTAGYLKLFVSPVDNKVVFIATQVSSKDVIYRFDYRRFEQGDDESWTIMNTLRVNSGGEYDPN
jgi:hypothetical protein